MLSIMLNKLLITNMQLFIILLLLVIVIGSDPNILEFHDDGQCGILTNGEGENKQYDTYNEMTNEILHNIQEAKESYRNCSEKLDDDDCECHREVILQDLSVFQNSGITKQMIVNAAKYGTRYQIYNNRLYRDQTCMFPTRCEGIEHFLLKLIKTLPDMIMVINTRDWPQAPKHFNESPIMAIFSFSKTHDYNDIMYPAWTFWSGGPAISLYPSGIGRWDLHRESLRQASNKYLWHKKKSLGFFRGSRTSDERDALILLSREQPDLVDAKYTKNQAWKSLKDTLNMAPAKEVSFENHCKYKYLFNFRGVAASFRLKHIFLCKSLVFHVGNEWIEFFYPALKPWQHYVPLNRYPTQTDIATLIEFFKNHDELANEIAQNGYKFIWEHLRMTDVECYWKHLLIDYAKLLQFKINKPNRNMIEIKVKKLDL